MWIKIGKRFALNTDMIVWYQKISETQLIIYTQSKTIKITFSDKIHTGTTGSTEADNTTDLKKFLAIIDEVIGDNYKKLNINPKIESYEGADS